MSTTNTSLMGHLARARFAIDDNRSAGSAASQSGALPVLYQVTRFTLAVSTGSVSLRDMLTNDTAAMNWVINDSANSINVYPFPGQNMNGSLNAALSIAAGGFGFFSQVKASLDWRAAAFT